MSNPFAALFNQNSDDVVPISDKPNNDVIEDYSSIEKSYFQKIFLFSDDITAEDIDDSLLTYLLDNDEPEVMYFLLDCFERLRTFSSDSEFHICAQRAIFTAATTALQSELYAAQSPPAKQLIASCLRHEFGKEFISQLSDYQMEFCPQMYGDIFSAVEQSVIYSSVLDSTQMVGLLTALIKNSKIGNLLFENFSKILITILSKSPLDTPELLAQGTTKDSVLAAGCSLQQSIANLFRHAISKNVLVHMWLADRAVDNASRAQLRGLNAVLPMGCIGDGAAFNLACVCLRLLRSFIKAPSDQSLLKINPSYLKIACSDTSVKERDDISCNLRLPASETCFIAQREWKVQVDSSFEAVCDMFHLTHRIFHLAFHRMHVRIGRMNQELHRLNEYYLERSRTTPLHSVPDEVMRAMQRFRSLQALMSEATFTELTFNFVTTTSRILGHYASVNHLSSELHTVQVPLGDSESLLHLFPEYMAHNIADFLLFTQRFNESARPTDDQIYHIQTFLLGFMCHKQRLANSSLRASLAECLELTVSRPGFKKIAEPDREAFEKLPSPDYVPIALVKLFIDIESGVSGDEMQFEEKFTYRRPVHKMLQMLWTIPRYREILLDLAKQACNGIHDADAPLFVHFVNLLLNDSVFLLDEAMQLIGQIRDSTQSADDPQLRHLLQYTRFHNVMADDIVATLRSLSNWADTRRLLMHPLFVERVASMLNYFLDRLVGSYRSQLTVPVQYREQVGFKPKKLVANICHVMLNLADGDTDSSFCTAVARDNRSFSNTLLSRAEEVLVRISNSDEVAGDVTWETVERLQALDRRLSSLSSTVDLEEDIEAPDHMLDPIMSTLMTDPVILPTSNTTIDRSTITRHLLSDQIDPFNRQPLTLDMIVPNVELKQEIDVWLKTRKSNKSLPSREVEESLKSSTLEELD